MPVGPLAGSGLKRKTIAAFKVRAAMRLADVRLEQFVGIDRIGFEYLAMQIRRTARVVGIKKQYED